MTSWLAMPFLRFLWRSFVYSIVPLLVAWVYVTSLVTGPIVEVFAHRNLILNSITSALIFILALRLLVGWRLGHHAGGDADEDSVRSVYRNSNRILILQCFISMAQVVIFILAIQVLDALLENGRDETVQQIMTLFVYLLSAGLIMGGLSITRIIARWVAYLQNSKTANPVLKPGPLSAIASSERWSHTVVAVLLLVILIACGYGLIGDVNLTAAMVRVAEWVFSMAGLAS